MGLLSRIFRTNGSAVASLSGQAGATQSFARKKAVPVKIAPQEREPQRRLKIVGEENRDSSPQDPVQITAASMTNSTLTPIKVNHVSGLPAYNTVLTVRGGDIAVSEACRQAAIAVQIGPFKAALILNGDASVSSVEAKSLRGHLRHRRFTIDSIYVATQDVFESIEQAPEDKSRLDEYVIHESAQSVKTFDMILDAGVGATASDIHICVRESGAAVLLRVFGLIFQIKTLPSQSAIEAVGVAYNKMAIETSRSKTQPQFNPRSKQYCVIDRVVQGHRWRFRYQSSPVEGGFDVVMRILPSEVVAEKKSLQELGYEDSQRESLRLAMMRSIGAVFIAGETGSGKSTTLMTLMTMEDGRSKHKWYSVEDPVEYKMYGVSQIPVQRDTSAEEDSAPFLEAFRALLRMDPNVIMIGEIRDKDTADLFAPAVMSGHRCLTTVHASSSLGIISRLTAQPIEMPRAVLAGKRFISALVYQSLVPILCPQCSRPAHEELEFEYLSHIEEKFQISAENMRVANELGCPHCRSGIIGQTVASEVLIPDTEMLILLRDGLDVEAELMWRKTRCTGFDNPDMTGKTAFEHALYKAWKGMVDPRHVEMVFESFKTYEVVNL